MQTQNNARSARKSKPMKVKAFVLKCVSEGLLSPSRIKAEYETAFPNAPKKSEECFQKAVKRAGYTKDVREKMIDDSHKRAMEKDIEQYEEVQAYIQRSKNQSTQVSQVSKMLKAIRSLWELSGKTDPKTWTEQGLLTLMESVSPMIEDERGRYRYEHPAKVLKLLSSFNTMFPNKLSKNWSKNLCIHGAGELKDFFTFEEFDLFISCIQDTEHMSVEGWKALFITQVNTQCREGSKEKTGILSLDWSQINFESKRCSMHEKGPHGKAGRVWHNLPLDMFQWLNGFELLKAWHIRNGSPFEGRVFPVRYAEYLQQFHKTRSLCNGRISGASATLRPHIFRRTSAQWKCEMGVEIPEICGSFPDGSFGVGWDDPKILLKYYIQLSEKRKQRAFSAMAEYMKEKGLGSVAPAS